MSANIKNLLKRLIKVTISYFTIAFGASLMIKADLGMNAWSTLDQGVSIFFGITFGQASIYLGIVVILADILMGMIPGLGTILNVFLIGHFIDWWTVLISDISMATFLQRIIGLLLGLVIVAVSSGTYISQQLGTGPRDGFSILLSRKLGIKFSKFRVGLEISALTIGYILGATVGIGTIIIALFSGPIMAKVMEALGYDPAVGYQENIFDTIRTLKESRI